MKHQMRIGEFLVSKKILTPQQVDRILEYSKMRNLRFGEAGMELGYLSRESFIKLFGPSFEVDLFHLDPAFFPQATRNIIPKEMILKYGVLPLGFKTERSLLSARKVLNLGFLSPYRDQFLSEINRYVEGKKAEIGFDTTKVYIILADQLLRVLDRVYAIPEAQILRMPPEAVDPTLMMYLEDLRENPAPSI